MNKGDAAGIVTPQSILMVRPLNFYVNPETALDNEFQAPSSGDDPSTIRLRALKEFENAVNTLRSAGINVIVFDSVSDNTPDSVFPNNWFSTHPDGGLVIYPMYAENRRTERRNDIIDKLKTDFRVSKTIDLSKFEEEAKFLEGTGAIVIDHSNNKAYCAVSKRADKSLFQTWAKEMNFEPVTFNTKGSAGKPIYHTNVILAIGEKFAVICPDFIINANERESVLKNLREDGKEIIILSTDQITEFAGNGLELHGKNGNIFVLSTTAFDSLTARQKERISQYAELVTINIPTIERAGGSARCMIAGIHLSEAKNINL